MAGDCPLRGLSFVVMAAAAVMAAFVTLAVVMAVMAAVMVLAVVMTVVVALRVGVELQISLRERECRRVSGSGHAAVEMNARFRERVARAHADAAADQSIRLRRFQKTGERAVAAAVRVHDLLSDDFAVFRIVELELLRVAEMLDRKSVV